MFTDDETAAKQLVWFEEATTGERIPIEDFHNDISEGDQETLKKIERKFAQSSLIAPSNSSAFDKFKRDQYVYLPEGKFFAKLEKYYPSKNNRPDYWEATKIIPKCNREKGKKEKEEKVDLFQKDNIKCMMYIEACLILEKHRVEVVKMRVNVEETIENFLHSIEMLHSVKCLAVVDGRQLNANNAFYNENIIEGTKILLFGVVSAINMLSCISDVKFFRRFETIRANDSWYVGEGRWDALQFTPSKNIRVYGTGLFEKHPSGGSFELGYKYIIFEGDNEVFKSEVFKEDIEPPPREEIKDHIIEYRFKNFPDGIEVKAGQKYNFCMWMKGTEHCFYTESGGQYRNVQNPDMDLFTVENSDLSSNSTTSSRGIIPGILYAIA